MKLKLHDYQDDAVRFVLNNRHCGIFADPGLGKSAIALSVIDELLLDPEFSGALIIAPLRVIELSWPGELKKWDDFEHLSHVTLYGVRRYEHVFTSKAKIFLLNTEHIDWLFQAIYHWQDWPFNTLIIDESSKFKASSTKRFKIIKKVLDRFRRVIIMTGTPASNSMEDLWSQIYFLDRGEALGRSMTAFHRKYFYPCGYKNKEWRLNPGADEKINDHIRHLVTRIDAKDHLLLPDLSKIIIKVKMDNASARVYRDVEQKLWAEIDGQTKLIPTAASKYAACRQIANGFLYEPVGMLCKAAKPIDRGVSEIHQCKLDALKDLIGELYGKPALVAYHYEQDLVALKSVLGSDTPHIGSGVRGAKLRKIVDAWNAGDIKVLLGHPASMAHGLNMQGVNGAVIFFSLTDNLENYIQFIGRLWRQGVQGAVKVYHLVTVGTVDVMIMRRLRQKEGTQNKLLDDLKKFKKNRKL